MINKKRGQISTEYLIVISFVTFVVLSTLGVAMYYSTSIKDTIKINQIEKYAAKITSSSESTFYSGEPSRVTITAYLPDGVTSISIIDQSLVFEVTTKSGKNRLAFPSNVPISGTLSTNPGVKRIQITAGVNSISLSEN